MERKTDLGFNPVPRSETPANNRLNLGMVVSNIHYTVLHQNIVKPNLLDCGDEYFGRYESSFLRSYSSHLCTLHEIIY